METTYDVEPVVEEGRVIQVLRENPILVISLTAMVLVCLVHPSFGLPILLFGHFFCCHNALCRDLQASHGSWIQYFGLTSYFMESWHLQFVA
uniref:Transmembrane protein n=1 Tax=Medicago truncatula TaxID=3880 RepID=A2Q2M8_MEDTR|nr:hypothetical protein MtrDRAFT_AC151521g39v2 [Medicago truncatula]